MDQPNTHYPNDIPRDYAIEPSERIVEVDGEQVRLVTAGLSMDRVRAAIDAEDKREAPGSGMMGFLIGCVVGGCIVAVILLGLAHNGVIG